MVFAASLALAACGGPSPVAVDTVGRHTVAEVVEAPATVSARASATVTAPADATVREILVADGAHVDQGQPILRLDSPEARARLSQARSALAAVARAPTVPRLDVSALQAQVDDAAQASFDAATEAADRIEDPDGQAAARAAIASSQARYAAARAQSSSAVDALNTGLSSVSAALRSITAAQRLQAEAAVAVAQQTVDGLSIAAPIAGTIQLTSSGAAASGDGLGGLLSQLPPDLAGPAVDALGSAASGAEGSQVPTDRTLRVGMPVAAGSTLALVVDASALGVVAQVDETDVLQVHPGVAATVSVDAAPGATYTARVASVDLAPTTSGQGGVSYRVVLDLGPGTADAGQAADTPAPTPRPGMSAVVRLQVRTATDVVAVPASAVVRDQGADIVWVSEEGRAQRRPVSLGAQGEDYVEVVAGLSQGETVVVSGADEVDEGQELG